MRTFQILPIAFISGILLLAGSSGVLAQATMSDHQHGDAHAEDTALSLDHGEKWQTDAPLRQGMESINAAVMDAAPAYHHETLTKADSEKLAAEINTQVNYLIENCELEPGADATLHVLIGDLLTAANEVSVDPMSKQGMPSLVKTMQQYQDYFEHPGLKSIH